MLTISVPRFGRICRLILIVLLATAAVATLTVPALAGSGTWTKTGSLNVGRQADTIALLQNGEVLIRRGRL